MSASRELRDWLDVAVGHYELSEDTQAVAAALIGVLAGVVASADANEVEQDRDAIVSRIHDLREWHDTKAEKATAYPGSGAENAARMAKAAEVHRDASARLFRVIYPEDADS